MEQFSHKAQIAKLDAQGKKVVEVGGTGHCFFMAAYIQCVPVAFLKELRAHRGKNITAFMAPLSFTLRLLINASYTTRERLDRDLFVSDHTNDDYGKLVYYTSRGFSARSKDQVTVHVDMDDYKAHPVCLLDAFARCVDFDQYGSRHNFDSDLTQLTLLTGRPVDAYNITGLASYIPTPDRDRRDACRNRARANILEYIERSMPKWKQEGKRALALLDDMDDYPSTSDPVYLYHMGHHWRTILDTRASTAPYGQIYTEWRHKFGIAPAEEPDL